MRRAAPKTWSVAAIYLMVVVLLYGAQIRIARGDEASCLARVAAYVAELDQLLATERNWITPYMDLNDRYARFEDCDTDALLIEASRSRFFRMITYNPRAKTYDVFFSSKDVEAGFGYSASEKPNAGWVNK